MPTVEDAHFLTGHFVINFVWVTRERQLADPGFIGRRSHVREIGKPAYPPLDRRYLPLRRCGLLFFREIRKFPRGPHAPEACTGPSSSMALEELPHLVVGREFTAFGLSPALTNGSARPIVESDGFFRF